MKNRHKDWQPAADRHKLALVGPATPSRLSMIAAVLMLATLATAQPLPPEIMIGTKSWLQCPGRMTFDGTQFGADADCDVTITQPGHGDGANCSPGSYPLGVDASGAVQSCTAETIFTPDSDPGVDHSGYVAGHGDGANCSAGSYPLGVDASGAVQSCTAETIFTPNSDPAIDHSGYVAGHGDGANCSAGSYPLGVDASGAVQSCTAETIFTPNSDPSVDHSGYVAGHGDGTNCSAGFYPLGVDGNGNVQSCTAAGGGGYDFDIQGDTGSATIDAQEILDVVGGNGITTAVTEASPNELLISRDGVVVVGSQAGVDCSGLSDSTTGVQAAFTAAGVGGTVLFTDGCMPAVQMDSIVMPNRAAMVCESNTSSGLQSLGPVCVGGLYEGAYCTATADCGTGGTCTAITQSVTRSAPTASTQYTLLSQASADGLSTIDNCGFNVRQSTDFDTCTGGSNDGAACRTVCSTNATDSTTPEVVLFGSLPLYYYCNLDSTCVSSVGALSTCIGLGDCTGGGTCTGTSGNVAGPGDVRAIQLGYNAVIRNTRVYDSHIAQTVVALGDQGRISSSVFGTLQRILRGTVAGPVAADVDTLLSVATYAVLTDFANDNRIKPTTAVTSSDFVNISGGNIDAVTTGLNMTSGVVRGIKVTAGTTGVKFTTNPARIVDSTVVVSGDNARAVEIANAATVSQNNLSATGVEGTCVYQASGLQDIVTENTFNNCYYAFDSASAAYNVTLSQNRIWYVNFTHGAAFFLNGAGQRAVNNYFNQAGGSSVTAKRCNSSCSGGTKLAGEICTADADCLGTCTNTILSPCEPDPIIWIGKPGQSLATSHAEIRDNLFFDPTVTGSTAIRFADRQSATGTIANTVIHGNDFLTADYGIDFGDLTGKGNSIDDIQITGNQFTSGVSVAALRFNSAVTGITGFEFAGNTGEPAAWVDDMTEWSPTWGTLWGRLAALSLDFGSTAIASGDWEVLTLPPHPLTVMHVRCEVYDGTSVALDLCSGIDTDGTCDTALVTGLSCGLAGSRGDTSSISNPDLTANGQVTAYIKSPSGSPHKLEVLIDGYPP